MIKFNKSYRNLLMSWAALLLSHAGFSQDSHQSLDQRQGHIVAISLFTASGDLIKLNRALHAGLDGGMTVNEVKEVLVHLYAYTGFPRSLQGINTLIGVLNERKSKGITDITGKSASPVNGDLSRYEKGKQVLESLTGQKEMGPKTGYAALSPEIEIFLKEHLFADLFTRDIISYKDREIATISALITLGGVEPMIHSHIKIALNLGMSEPELNHLIAIIGNENGETSIRAARNVLATVTGKRNSQAHLDSVFFNLSYRGSLAPAERFTGNVWLNMLVQPGDSLGYSMGLVTFEAGARSNWHKHSGGQVLLVTSGRGYYQEKGYPIKFIYKGDVIKCPANIEHWHGASHGSEMSHVSLTGNLDKGPVVWLAKVTDEQYHAVK